MMLKCKSRSRIPFLAELISWSIMRVSPRQDLIKMSKQEGWCDRSKLDGRFNCTIQAVVPIMKDQRIMGNISASNGPYEETMDRPTVAAKSAIIGEATKVWVMELGWYNYGLTVLRLGSSKTTANWRHAWRSASTKHSIYPSWPLGVRWYRQWLSLSGIGRSFLCQWVMPAGLMAVTR